MLICSCFNKSAVQEYLHEKGLRAFSEVDGLTAFHGSHVNDFNLTKEEDETWRQLIQIYMLSDPVWKQLCERYADLL